MRECTLLVSRCSFSVPSPCVCLCVCVCVYNTFLSTSSSHHRDRRGSPSRSPSLRSLPSHPPSSLPPSVHLPFHGPGRPVLSRSSSPSPLPLSLTIPRRLPVSFSLPFLSRRGRRARACRICGLGSVCPRAQICARRPYDDREREVLDGFRAQ